MSEEEINVASAEACGWSVSEYGWWSHPTLPDNGGAMPEPPDYCNDLNAMHEAETTLTDEQHKHFRNNLLFPNCYKMEKALAERQVVSATARQRAEAFLRVFDKWKEEAASGALKKLEAAK